MIVILGGTLGTLLAVGFFIYLAGILILKFSVNMFSAFLDVFEDWKDVYLYEKYYPKPLRRFLISLLNLSVFILILYFLEATIGIISDTFMTFGNSSTTSSDKIFLTTIITLFLLCVVFLMQLPQLSIKKKIYKGRIMVMKAQLARGELTADPKKNKENNKKPEPESVNENKTQLDDREKVDKSPSTAKKIFGRIMAFISWFVVVMLTILLIIVLPASTNFFSSMVVIAIIGLIAFPFARFLYKRYKK